MDALSYISITTQVPQFIFDESVEQFPESFHASIKAYRESEQSIHTLAAAPIVIGGLASLYEHFNCTARVQNGRPIGDFIALKNPDSIFADLQSAHALLRKWMEEHNEEGIDRLRVYGTLLTDGLESAHPNVNNALQSIIRAVVTGTWTAFEVLANDLWISALNAHPKRLAHLSGKWWKDIHNGMATDDGEEEGEEENEKKGEKMIKLSTICYNEFNLSKKMGNVLKERFRWNTLGGIIKAYGSAFSRRENKIKQALTSPILRAIVAARNCIVHKAGKVDKSFFRQKGNWPGFDNAKEGELLHLTGDTVQELRVGTIKAGIDLIHSVKEWMETN